MSEESSEKVEVAIATLDGKAYYLITTLLKKIGVPFSNVAPGDRLNQRVKLVLTTRKERGLIDHSHVLCVEDLGDDPIIAKERIFNQLYGGREGIFVIGIDPGERTGLAAYCQQKEVESCILSSIEDVVDRVVRLVGNSPCLRRIVRIGDGKPELAARIASSLYSRLKDRVEIELVDERGTSTLVGRVGKRCMRDQRSARIIAFRQGRRFPED